MPAARIPYRLMKTGGKIRKGFSTAKQGPDFWQGNVDWKVRSMGIPSKRQGYIPINNRIPLFLVPDLKDFKLKPYLSPHTDEVENYPPSYHDVMVVMQAEGYVPSETRVEMPEIEKGSKLGFPEEKTLDDQVDQAMKEMPMSIYEREVQRTIDINTPIKNH